MNKETLGVFLAIGTAIISGFSIFANKWLSFSFDPMIFTAIRALIIGAIFLLLSLKINKWSFKRFAKVPWIYLLIIGIIGGGLAFWLFFSGLKLTTAGRAAFIHKTLPLFVTLLAFTFLKEKISSKQWIALLVMLFGLFFISYSQINPSEWWSNPGLGDILVLSATFLWGIENVISKKAMINGENNFIVSFSRMFFGAIFLFGLAILLGKINLFLSLTGVQWIKLVASTILLFGYVLTFYWSIKYISVSRAATLLLLAPIITFILGAIILKEPTPILQIIGSALILFGAYFLVQKFDVETWQKN